MPEQPKWRFSDLWNSALISTTERPKAPRSHLWASELAKAPIDVWHRLKGTPATNWPNDRSKRKFEAGNVFEWVVGTILNRCGILKASQTRYEIQYPGLLKVTGKLDYMAGGKPDYERWKEEAEKAFLPEVFYRAGENIIKEILQNYPGGIAEQPLEIKSVSSFIFEAMERTGRINSGHRRQLFHYLKGSGRPEGIVVCICRDDLRIREFVVKNDSETEDDYREAIKAISFFHRMGNPPPKEQLITFDGDIGKFSRNHKVGYSEYLTMLYGFKTQKEFEDIARPKAERWNRVLKRIKNGDKMTGNNLEALEEIKQAGFDIEKIKANFADTAEEEEN